MPSTKAGRGRPKKAAGERAQTKTLRLYPDDLARLQRLMVRLRLSESGVVREALSRLDADA